RLAGGRSEIPTPKSVNRSRSGCDPDNLQAGRSRKRSAILVRSQVRAVSGKRQAHVHALVDEIAAGSEFQEAYRWQRSIGVAWTTGARIIDRLKIGGRYRDSQVPGVVVVDNAGSHVSATNRELQIVLKHGCHRDKKSKTARHILVRRVVVSGYRQIGAVVVEAGVLIAPCEIVAHRM